MRLSVADLLEGSDETAVDSETDDPSIYSTSPPEVHIDHSYHVQPGSTRPQHVGVNKQIPQMVVSQRPINRVRISFVCVLRHSAVNVLTCRIKDMHELIH